MSFLQDAVNEVSWLVAEGDVGYDVDRVEYVMGWLQSFTGATDWVYVDNGNWVRPTGVELLFPAGVVRCSVSPSWCSWSFDGEVPGAVMAGILVAFMADCSDRGFN